MLRLPHVTRLDFILRLALLAGLAMAVFVAGGNTVGLWDRDEPWYAEISREMVRSGDWVVPRFLGVVFVGKPVFAFWCAAVSISWLGDSILAARLPSALAMVASMLVMAAVVARFAGRRRALWTAFILGTTVLSLALAKMCLTDAILLLWITIAQLALYALYQGRGGWRAVLSLWTAIGLAILTKGPVVVGIQLATLLALLVLDVQSDRRSPRAWLNAMRWWLRSRPWIGVFIAAAVVLPWMAMIQRREPGFLSRTWIHNMYGPIAHTALEGHSGPPGYFLALIWPFFMPWSLLLPLALFKGWSNRRLPAIRFALAAVIGPWIVIELIRQKLPHYLLPLFPFLAFLTADALVRCIRGQYADLVQPRFVRGVAVWVVVVALAGLIPFVGSLRAFRAPGLPWVAMTLLGLGAIAYAVGVHALFRRRRIALAARVMGAGVAVGVAFLFAFVLPHLQFMRISQRAADVLLADGANGDDVATLLAKHDGGKEEGYKEPSLAYDLGGHLDVQDATLLNARSDRWPTWLVMTDDLWAHTSDAARAHLRPLATIRGLNYGGGGRMTNVIVARKIDVVDVPR